LISIRKIDYSIIIDKRYDKIKVIKKDEEKSLILKKEYYICECDCGNIVSIRANDLYNHKIKSCGCYNPKQYKNIQNIKFGKLTALEYKYTINKKAYWLCECECGKLIITSSSNLNSGHTTSCGCNRNIINVGNLSKHFRNLLFNKIKSILESCNYKCCLTGTQDNLEVHHLESFSSLYKNTIINLGLPLYDNFYNYSSEQQKEIDTIFLKHHDDNILIVINRNIHIDFHKIYGYGNNTKEQFSDFIKKYYSNSNIEEPFPLF